MSSPFAITTSSSTVPLDGNRQGQTSFTVTNTTPQPIQGRARLVSQQPEAQAWMTLEGEAERTFADEQSQQYVVQVTVPPSAPTGDYTFRLDLVDEANPDENFSQGPTVKFTVAAPVIVKKRSFPWWIVAVVVGALILLGGGIYALIPKSPTALLSQWTTSKPMLTGRFGLAAVQGTDGHIYTIGGIDSSSNALNTVEVYDPKTGNWTTLKPMLAPVGLMGTVLGPDGRIYAIGGYNAGAAVNTVEAYDPKTGNWTTLKPIPTARFGLAAVLGSDGRIYAIGGGNSTGLLNTVEAYDPKTDTWTSRASMPTPRFLLAAVAGPDGRIYAIGGAASSFTPLNTVEAYDPKTNTWTSSTSMPVASLLNARYGLAAVLGPDGRIYAIGGLNSSTGNHAVNTVEAYDPRTNIWTSVASMPSARGFLAAVLGPDKHIYAIGGYNSSALTTVEVGYGTDWR